MDIDKTLPKYNITYLTHFEMVALQLGLNFEQKMLISCSKIEISIRNSIYGSMIMIRTCAMSFSSFGEKKKKLGTIEQNFPHNLS